MGVRKAKHGGVLTVIFTILSVIWVCPILIVIMNSFKKKAYINRKPFAFPAGKSFVGIENYLNGIKKINFFQAFAVYYLILGSSDHRVYFHVRMVHHQSYQPYDKRHLLSVPVCNDRSVPDGNVYVIQICEYVTSWKSGRYHLDLSRIRSRAGGIYVLRFRKGNSA